MAEESNTTIISDRRSNTESALIGLSKDLEYLQRDIKEIKNDVKDIKSENITRREFEDYKKDTDKKISFITGVMYTIGSTIILGVIGAVLKLVLK